MTGRHVLGVEDPDESSARAYEQARSAWEVWGERHDQTRAWVEEALAEARGLIARRSRLAVWREAFTESTSSRPVYPR